MGMNKRYLNDSEQRRLLQCVAGHAGPLAQRDHAWMKLLIETGMRIAEMSTLTKRQAEAALASGWLVVTKEQRKGKRRGHEYLVTHPVRQALERLLHLQAELRPAMALPDDVVPPLLWGRCGVVGGKLMCEHMSVRSFQARMKHWVYLAGLPEGISPHWMRHTRGVNVVQRCRGKNPLKVAQLALGHENIASTAIYTQMSRSEFEAEMHAVAGGRMPKARAVAMAGGVR